MNKNDEKIMKLREAIAEKRKELDGSEHKRFSPITHCRVPVELVSANSDGYYNLNAMSKGALVNLLIKLNMYRLSMVDLGLDTSSVPYGWDFSIDDIIRDISAKIAVYNYREEMQKLDVLEARLEELLSDEKQKELEIENIEKMFNI